MVANQYKVERISSIAQLEELREPWETLGSKTSQCSFFLNWHWVYAWWKNLNDTNDLWILAAVDNHGVLVGVAPLMCCYLKLGAIAIRSLKFIGCGLADPVQLDFLAERQDLEKVTTAVLNYLELHQKEWDLLDLYPLCEKSPLRTYLSKSKGICIVRDLVEYLLMSLPTSWELFEKNNMSSKLKKTLRYYKRRLEKDFSGNFSFDLISNEVELKEALAFLFKNSRINFRNKIVESCFDRNEFCGFYEELTKSSLLRGSLRFFQLKINDQIVAVQQCFAYKGVYFGYQTSFDNEWQKYSPGQQLLFYAFENAISENISEVNMSHGQNFYKKNLATHKRLDLQILYGRKKAVLVWLICLKVYDNLLLSAKTLNEKLRSKFFNK